MGLQRFQRDRRQARLLRAARGGDASAFRQLYRELFNPVAHYFYSRVERREEAEEMIAQVFHNFLEKLGRFDPARGSVLSWLLTMAHHSLVDYYRAQRQTKALDEIAETLASRRADPLEELIRSERIRRVRELLNELSPDTRYMFALRFEYDLRYREIGACMGLSEAAVKQRFSRVMRDLRTSLPQRNNDIVEVDYAF